MHKRVSAHGGPFTTLVRTYPYGTDPEILPTRPGQPPPLRNTITQQVIWTDKGATLNNARMVPGTPPLTVEAASGMFLVADNNFTTGRAALLLGDFALVSNIDYAVGGGVAATAINIAAAINRLPGFFATFIGPVVTVGYDAGPADVVEFRAVYYGSHTNFALNPDTGELHTGSPFVGPPLIT